MLNLAEIRLLTEEINELTAGGAVQKVLAYGESGHVFRIRSPGVTHLLLVEYSPEAGRVGLLSEKPPQPQTASAVTMALRDKLNGSRLQSIACAENDRVITLRFHAGDDLQLVLELTGRSTRASLTDGSTVVHPMGGTAETIGRGATLQRPEAGTQPSMPRWGLADTPIGARSIVVETAYRDIEAALALGEAKASALSDIRRSLKRKNRLLRNLNKDLTRAENADTHKRSAELLQSAYGRVERGAEFVEVQDFYDPELQLVKVPLDPKRSLQDNIDRHFRLYRRLKNAVPAIESRVLEVMEKVEELEAARDSVQDLSLDATNQLHQDLLARRLVAPKSRAKRGVKGSTKKSFRTYYARSGREIYVGRGAKENDILTTRVARGRDIWMHARDWAGSHVLLRLNRGEEATGEDLVDAALLAAHFSKGKSDSLVDVTHTHAKNVRKPKGAAPGLVTVSGGSTVTVNPAAPRLVGLLTGASKNE